MRKTDRSDDDNAAAAAAADDDDDDDDHVTVHCSDAGAKLDGFHKNPSDHLDADWQRSTKKSNSQRIYGESLTNIRACCQ